MAAHMGTPGGLPGPALSPGFPGAPPGACMVASYDPGTAQGGTCHFAPPHPSAMPPMGAHGVGSCGPSPAALPHLAAAAMGAQNLYQRPAFSTHVSQNTPQGGLARFLAPAAAYSAPAGAMAGPSVARQPPNGAAVASQLSSWGFDVVHMGDGGLYVSQRVAPAPAAAGLQRDCFQRSLHFGQTMPQMAQQPHPAAAAVPPGTPAASAAAAPRASERSTVGEALQAPDHGA